MKQTYSSAVAARVRAFIVNLKKERGCLVVCGAVAPMYTTGYLIPTIEKSGIKVDIIKPSHVRLHEHILERDRIVVLESPTHMVDAFIIDRKLRGFRGHFFVVHFDGLAPVGSIPRGIVTTVDPKVFDVLKHSCWLSGFTTITTANNKRPKSFLELHNEVMKKVFNIEPRL